MADDLQPGYLVILRKVGDSGYGSPLQAVTSQYDFLLADEVQPAMNSYRRSCHEERLV
jgi:hypothetical protein